MGASSCPSGIDEFQGAGCTDPAPFRTKMACLRTTRRPAGPGKRVTGGFCTRTREVDGLIEAMTETGLDQSVIVTLAEDETVEMKSGTIRVVPAWRWMLESSEPR